MTQSDVECSHANCEDPVEVVRVCLRDEGEYGYCEDHDPLEDGLTEDAFEEVGA